MSNEADILKDLNEAQLAAVTHEQGPLLIVAGAGTGKTAVITKRIAWLILNNKAKADEVLALTFTDKAAGEMEERVDKLLPYGYTDLWVATFHSFAERILKIHALDIGVPYDFRLLDETEQWLMIRQNLDKFNLNYYRPLGNPTKFIHALVRHFSRAKDEGVMPEQYLAYAESARLDLDRERGGKAKLKKSARGRSAAGGKSEVADEVSESDRLQEVAGAYHTYQQLLLDNNALDFGDLILYTLRLFRERPDVLAQYQKQFKYVLVDEFQDTNSAQYELVRRLVETHQNIAVVGDDDQSIYRFRGAAMSNILQFSADWPKAKRVVLTNNYRSAQNILDLAYKFIQTNNPNRLEVSLNDLDKKLIATTTEVGEIKHLAGLTADDEEHLVIGKIKEIKELNQEDKAGELSWGDFAVLARSNDEANRFDLALGRAGIPHQSFTAQGLYAKPTVIDALSYLRLLDNYHESTALWRVLNMPHWKMVGRDLIELSHFSSRKSQSLFRSIEQAGAIPNISAETVTTINSLLKYLTDHTALSRNLRPTEILVRALTDIGYVQWIETLGEATAKIEFSYLNQFYQRIKRWEESQSSPRLKDFLATINYEIESGEEGRLLMDPETGPDVVRVMTVHSAKGLEFKYVFLVGIVERRFPTYGRRDPIDLPAALVKEIVPTGDLHLEEERRLFYVGMTRAKRGLYFTSAEDYGGVRKKKLSPFLTELELELAKPIAAAPVHPFGASARVAVESALTDYLPTKFSFTQLKAFEVCPFQYRFAHVLKVPVWGKHTFSFGTSMHSTLERFFKLIQERRSAVQPDLFAKSQVVTLPNLEDLLKIYEESWIEEWYQNRAQAEDYKKNGREILKNFFARHDGNWPDTKYIEKGFTLKIGDYTLTGKVDRVDVRGGGIEIVDYKTGSVPKTEADLDKDQLLIYQLAAEVVWKEKPVALTFYYLNQNKPMTFLGTPEDLVEIQAKMSATIEKIHKGDFPPTPAPFKCKFCDFKDICEFRQLE